MSLEIKLYYISYATHLGGIATSGTEINNSAFEEFGASNKLYLLLKIINTKLSAVTPKISYSVSSTSEAIISDSAYYLSQTSTDVFSKLQNNNIMLTVDKQKDNPSFELKTVTGTDVSLTEIAGNSSGYYYCTLENKQPNEIFKGSFDIEVKE